MSVKSASFMLSNNAISFQSLKRRSKDCGALFGLLASTPAEGARKVDVSSDAEIECCT